MEAYIKYKYPKHKWKKEFKEYINYECESCGYCEVETLFIEEVSIKGEHIALTQDRLDWIIKQDDNKKRWLYSIWNVYIYR